MADLRFRQEQWDRRYDENVGPINRLVDDLQAENDRGWMPYVAPMYGGVHARLLSLLRDPGPKTVVGKGSGFLSMENDDPSAEAIHKYFSDAGIAASEVVPWNAYPWYINRNPLRKELEAGLDPLKRLIDLLPRLKVVMLHSGAARNAWKLLMRRFPDHPKLQRLCVIGTHHTSRQAFWHSDPLVREGRRENLRQAFASAAHQLNSSDA
jgi:hypothetical protein